MPPEQARFSTGGGNALAAQIRKPNATSQKRFIGICSGSGEGRLGNVSHQPKPMSAAHHLRGLSTALRPSANPLGFTLIELLVIFVSAHILLAPCIARAQHNPGIVDPTNSYAGKTYSEWAAGFWQYYTSLPTTDSPLSYYPGYPRGRLGTGQNGPVWFLGGNIFPGGSYYFSDTVPGGVALFTLVVLSERGNDTCEPTRTEAQMRAYTKAQVDQAINLSLTIDGVAMNSLDDVLTSPYRVQSPLFNYTCPAVHNVLFDAFGRSCYYPNPGGPPFAINGAVVDGVFLMVSPLSAGQHTIQGTLTLPQFGLTETWTRDLTVLPVALTLSTSDPAGNVVLTWPQTPDNYTVESSPSLSPPDWQSANLIVTTNNGILQATGPVGTTNQFFRLRLN
jgi:hypothetical protein